MIASLHPLVRRWVGVLIDPFAAALEATQRAAVAEQECERLRSRLAATSSERSLVMADRNGLLRVAIERGAEVKDLRNEVLVLRGERLDCWTSHGGDVVGRAEMVRLASRAEEAEHQAAELRTLLADTQARLADCLATHAPERTETT